VAVVDHPVAVRGQAGDHVLRRQVALLQVSLPPADRRRANPARLNRLPASRPQAGHRQGLRQKVAAGRQLANGHLHGLQERRLPGPRRAR